MLLLLHLPAPGGRIQELQVQLDAGFARFFAYHDEPWRVLVGAIADSDRESLAILHSNRVGTPLRPTRRIEIAVGFGEVERQRFDRRIRVAPVGALPSAVQSRVVAAKYRADRAIDVQRMSEPIADIFVGKQRIIEIEPEAARVTRYVVVELNAARIALVEDLAARFVVPTRRARIEQEPVELAAQEILVRDVDVADDVESYRIDVEAVLVVLELLTPPVLDALELDVAALLEARDLVRADVRLDAPVIVVDPVGIELVESAVATATSTTRTASRSAVSARLLRRRSCSRRACARRR